MFKIVQHANLIFDDQNGSGRWPRKPYGEYDENSDFQKS